MSAYYRMPFNGHSDRFRFLFLLLFFSFLFSFVNRVSLFLNLRTACALQSNPHNGLFLPLRQKYRYSRLHIFQGLGGVWDDKHSVFWIFFIHVKPLCSVEWSSYLYFSFFLFLYPPHPTFSLRIRYPPWAGSFLGGRCTRLAAQLLLWRPFPLRLWWCVYIYIYRCVGISTFVFTYYIRIMM